MKLQDKFMPTNKNEGLLYDLDKFCSEKKLNKLVYESVEELSKRIKPILFILAENDHGYDCFKQHFEEDYLKRNSRNQKILELFKVFVIKNANHIYTFTEWQEELINKISEWIQARSN